MPSYRQLSIEERCEIARLHEAGQSIRQIASALDRQPSSISRELTRNSGSKIGYRPDYAQAQASARRWSGSRLERNETLREGILDRLADGWSPEQIAGRLARDAGHRIISHETIYRFVHAQMRRYPRCRMETLSAARQAQARMAQPRRWRSALCTASLDPRPSRRGR